MAKAKEILKRRDKKRRYPVLFSPEALAALVEAFDRVEAAPTDQHVALEQCLEKLPDRSRRLLKLRYEQSLKLREVAEVLGASLDSVHKALSRLRDRLRDCVERRLGTRLGEA